MMTPESLWDRIADAGPAALVLVVAVLGVLALPVLRLLAPRGRRNRGGSARLFFIIAVLLALGAFVLGTMGASSPGNLMQLASVLALLIGMVGLAGVFAFDVIFPRLHVYVPAILRDVLGVIVAVAVSMGFLRLAGLDIFSLVTTSAVLTAVIGLALQSTIANIFSGLGLQLDRTLRHGEWIEVGSHIGRILEIGWRSTRIETRDGDTIYVPNSELVSKEVRNFGRPRGSHRVTVRVSFHYRHPPTDVQRVLLDAIRDVPGVAAQPPATCGPVDFGDSGVVYSLRYWITDFAHKTGIDEEVRTRVWYAANRGGLEMPFPTRTVISERDTAGARAAAEARTEAEALQLLRACEAFSGLDEDGRRRCARGAQRLDFAPQETVWAADAADDRLYIIASGAVSIGSANGAAAARRTLQMGELIGQRVVPTHTANPVGYAACTAVVVYAIEQGALAETLAAYPQIEAHLADIATARDAELDRVNAAAPSTDHAAALSTAARLAPRLRRLFGRD